MTRLRDRCCWEYKTKKLAHHIVLYFQRSDCVSNQYCDAADGTLYYNSLSCWGRKMTHTEDFIQNCLI